MMNRLGVTLSDLSEADVGAPLTSAVRTCQSCTHSSECEAWLSHGNVSYAADAPGFCPNATLFRRLRSLSARIPQTLKASPVKLPQGSQSPISLAVPYLLGHKP
jgi:hypothetical protein